MMPSQQMPLGRKRIVTRAEIEALIAGGARATEIRKQNKTRARRDQFTAEITIEDALANWDSLTM